VASTRRTFIRSGVGAGALVLLGTPADVLAARRKLRLARDATFAQGVASGEPGPHAITLWTRLEGLEKPALTGVEVARDPHFRHVVHTARLPVSGAHDWTARTRVTGLKAGEEYHYRFATADAHSHAGRFRTAYPAGSHQPLRIAFFSCQEFTAGYYHAHRDLLTQDVDLVVCLGDYIYEKAYETPVRPDDSAPIDGEAQTLAEYRAKYSIYHSDAYLREVRRNFALVAEWDDHEVEDNYAGELGGGAAGTRRVPFPQRRANAYRAYFEHMPRRLRRDLRTYGSVPLGNAELFLLDDRQYRGDQPCNPTDSFLSQPCPPSTTDDPSRAFLGGKQQTWLKRALSASKARWKLIANQVMISSLDFPPGNPLNTDSWDGYGAARADLVHHIANDHIHDVVFVTGDIHTFFTGHVTESGRRTVRDPELPDPVRGPVRATEFVCGAVTSPGIVDRALTDEAARVAAAAPVDAAVMGNSPQLVYANEAYKGYGLVTAGRDLRVRYQAVHDVRQPQSGVFTLRRFHVESGKPFVHDDGGPVPLPAPAPPGTLPPLPGIGGLGPIA
jgi:alkaline phosphatase D